MANKQRLLVAVLLVGLLILACNISQPTPPPADGLATAVAATLAASPGQPPTEPLPLPAPTSTPTEELTLLPHPLYFMADVDGVGDQVWRLARDGVTQTQITFEPAEVVNYHVSPVDGSVVYVVNNQLYWVDANGEGRRLLVDGGPVDESADEYHYRTKLSTPRWSPDGSRVAFAQNGIKIYTLETGAITHLVTNELEVLEGGYLFPRALYFPNQWSLDGLRLLVDKNFHEGGTLVVFTPESGDILEFDWPGIICCHASWASDGSAIVVASPFLGLIESGMWRFDANTGAGVTLLPTTADDGTINFAGWPIYTPSGSLQFFYNNTPAVPEGEVPLVMVRSAVDGVTARAQLRPELFELYEALWAPEGDLAVVVQPGLGEPSWPRRGPIVLLPADGGPILPLVINGYDLRWGP